MDGHGQVVSGDSMARLRGRAELASELATVSTVGELLERTLAGLPKLFAPVQRAEVYLADADGQLEPVAGLGGGLDVVARRGGVVDLRAPARHHSNPAAAHGSLATAPLLDGTRVMGTLMVERPIIAPEFTRADLDQLAIVCAQVSQILQRMQVLALCQQSLWSHLQSTSDEDVAAAVEDWSSNLADGTDPAVMPRVVSPPATAVPRPSRRSAELRRVEHDLRMAREIQRRFLPALPSDLSGMHVAAEYRPAFEVGGDFYDLVEHAPGRFVAIVGDVSGKGVSAALIMSRVMSEFRAVSARSSTPSVILSDLNAFLVDEGHDDTFVTATCVEINAAERVATVANAGHVPPFLRHTATRVHRVGEASGAPLGLVPGETYRDDAFCYSGRDILLLMTDGVTEAFDPLANTSNQTALLALIGDAGGDVDQLTRRLLAEVEIARGGRRADDVALLALQLP